MLHIKVPKAYCTRTAHAVHANWGLMYGASHAGQTVPMTSTAGIIQSWSQTACINRQTQPPLMTWKHLQYKQSCLKLRHVCMQIGLEELVPAVRHLVEYERNSLAAADTIAAAEGVVAAQPDVLLHRIVAQFQHLFDCPRLEGVLPTLNQVTAWYCYKLLPVNSQRNCGAVSASV